MESVLIILFLLDSYHSHNVDIYLGIPQDFLSLIRSKAVSLIRSVPGPDHGRYHCDACFLIFLIYALDTATLRTILGYLSVICILHRVSLTRSDDTVLLFLCYLKDIRDAVKPVSIGSP